MPAAHQFLLGGKTVGSSTLLRSSGGASSNSTAFCQLYLHTCRPYRQGGQAAYTQMGPDAAKDCRWQCPQPCMDDFMVLGDCNMLKASQVQAVPRAKEPAGSQYRCTK